MATNKKKIINAKNYYQSLRPVVDTKKKKKPNLILIVRILFEMLNLGSEKKLFEKILLQKLTFNLFHTIDRFGQSANYQRIL